MAKSPDAFRTISEVADWLGVEAHVLRFWESRFTQVKPVKRAGGRRYYRPSDMALLGGIRKLLHDDGLTIRGVQKILREHGVSQVAAMSPELAFDEPEALPRPVPAPPAPLRRLAARPPDEAAPALPLDLPVRAAETRRPEFGPAARRDPALPESVPSAPHTPELARASSPPDTPSPGRIAAEFAPESVRAPPTPRVGMPDPGTSSRETAAPGPMAGTPAPEPVRAPPAPRAATPDPATPSRETARPGAAPAQREDGAAIAAVLRRRAAADPERAAALLARARVLLERLRSTPG